MAENYRDLIAWQKAKGLALNIYRCTRLFPRDEVYGLSSQMRRAAVSVPSNIAKEKDAIPTRSSCNFFIMPADPSSN
jgi:four helix bundle protein